MPPFFSVKLPAGKGSSSSSAQLGQRKGESAQRQGHLHARSRQGDQAAAAPATLACGRFTRRWQQR
jgi:hypothetical protein